MAHKEKKASVNPVKKTPKNGATSKSVHSEPLADHFTQHSATEGTFVTVSPHSGETVHVKGKALPPKSPTPNKTMSGAEALAYWRKEGVLGTFSNRPEDSPELARELRRQAETRDWDEA